MKTYGKGEVAPVLN